MTDPHEIDDYVHALQEDFPTSADEVRIRRRLVGAGLGAGLTLGTKLAVAGGAATKAASIGKLGLGAGWMARFSELSLLAQFGLVTAATTVVASVPVALVVSSRGAEPAARVSRAEAQDRGRSAALPLGQSTPQATVALPPEETSIGTTRANTPLRAAAAPLSENGVGSGVRVDDSRSPPAPAMQQATRESTLAEETRLIDAALTEMRTSHLTKASYWLAEHERRFTDGLLARERRRAQQQLERLRREGSR